MMQIFKPINDQILTEKYLPHNFLAEQMILNCLLINRELIEITFQTISIEAFYFKNHQEIYKAIIYMYKNKLPIDIITFITFLQNNGLLGKIGGIKVLMELITHIPNLVYLDEYIRLVKDKFLRRSLIKLGYETINSGYITNISVENDTCKHSYFICWLIVQSFIEIIQVFFVYIKKNLDKIYKFF